MKNDNHITPEDVHDILRNASNEPYLTFFLSEDDAINLEEAAHHAGLFCQSLEHYPREERHRLVIYKPSDSDNLPDEDVHLLRVILPKKGLEYQRVGHRDVLGSLMGLGIKRNTIGDILFDQNNIYVFCTGEILPYLLQDFRSISKFDITPQEISLAEAGSFSAPTLEEETIIVASLRLDNIVAKLLKTAKTPAQDFISQGYVKVNGEIIKKCDRMVKSNDRLSVKTIGHVVIKEEQGSTKSDRIRLLIERTR